VITASSPNRVQAPLAFAPVIPVHGTPPLRLYKTTHASSLSLAPHSPLTSHLPEAGRDGALLRFLPHRRRYAEPELFVRAAHVAVPLLLPARLRPSLLSLPSTLVCPSCFTPEAPSSLSRNVGSCMPPSYSASVATSSSPFTVHVLAGERHRPASPRSPSVTLFSNPFASPP
jgi:hypothetical protein